MRLAAARAAPRPPAPAPACLRVPAPPHCAFASGGPSAAAAVGVAALCRPLVEHCRRAATAAMAAPPPRSLDTHTPAEGGDGRILAAAAERNKGAILEALLGFLRDAPGGPAQGLYLEASRGRRCRWC